MTETKHYLEGLHHKAMRTTPRTVRVVLEQVIDSFSFNRGQAEVATAVAAVNINFVERKVNKKAGSANKFTVEPIVNLVDKQVWGYQPQKQLMLELLASVQQLGSKAILQLIV